MLRVVEQRHVAGQRRDLDLRAERHRAGPQRAIDLPAGVLDRLGGLAAHHRLQAHIVGDDVDQVAAAGEDRMDADGVLVAERLALGVDRGQRDLARRRAR